jgi:hypothetical protein
MIGHPLLLSVAAVDFVTLTALLAALWALFPIAVRWAPGSADRGQLALERRAEAGAFAVRIAAASLLASTLLLTAAFALALPRTVSGAMCGTGVMQAMGGAGYRAIGFRLFALLCLSAWQMVEGLNHSQPEAPLTEAGVRIFLAAAPAVLLALMDTVRALSALDTGIVVDCCAAVYDPVVSAGRSVFVGGVADRLWVVAFALLSVLVGAAAVSVKRAASLPRVSTWLLAAAALLWTPAAAISLVRVFSASIFGVLAHPCPWCLFLPEHGMVGFVQFGALAVAAREGIVAPVALWAADRDGTIRSAAADRLSKAAGRLLCSLAVFLVATVGPALLWRVRHGVWIWG